MSELLERARAAVREAQKQGAQQARATATRSRETTVEWRDDKLDRLGESTRLSLNLALYVDGRYSANATSDLRPDAVARWIAESIASTRLLAADPHRKLPDPARYAGRFAGDLQLVDAAAATALTVTARRNLARDLVQAARAVEGADRILSVTGSVGDDESEQAKVCSNGMEGTERSTSFWLAAETTVRGEGDSKPEGWWWAADHRRDRLPTAEAVGAEATRRALGFVGAGPMASGRYPCVVENAVCGRLLGGLQGPLSGRSIQQKRSFLADKLGQPIASKVLTVVDDPLLPGGLGSSSFDGEGMSLVQRPLIEQGVLRSHYLDTYYASKLGREPTTAGPSNLVFTQGAHDLDGLLRQMKQGILIRAFSGGNSNDATGDFSVGIRGFWVEDGKPVKPLSEMNLAGNHLEFWKALEELGNDPFTSSSLRCPSLRFGAVQFSGV